MFNELLKRLRERLNPPKKVVAEEETIHAHLCEGKEWKECPAALCPVCRGDSMNFFFRSRERFNEVVELKDKQQDRKAS